MSLVGSSKLPLGSRLPSFVLDEPLTGKAVSEEQFSGSPLLLAIICNHCPYVVHIKEGFARLAKNLLSKGVSTVAISSNDPSQHPMDAPGKMAQEAELYEYTFPYLFDDAQNLARDLRAVCTPEFYLFDAEQRLVYRGQMDAARPNNDEPNDGRDIQVAVSAMLSGAAPIDLQPPSIGCSIKWRAGHTPAYVTSALRSR